MISRNYPIFLIDTSRSDSPYVVCLDREVGFVARVLFFSNDDAYNEFIIKANDIGNYELSGVTLPLKRGGILLQVLDFLYYFEITPSTKKRIQSLLKRGLKKYVHGEIGRSSFNKNDLGVDNQINQQRLTLERAIENYDELVKRYNGNKSIADLQIDLQKETIRSLERYKEMKSFFESGFNINFDPTDQGS